MFLSRHGALVGLTLRHYYLMSLLFGVYYSMSFARFFYSLVSITYYFSVSVSLGVLSVSGYMKELTFQHKDGSFSAFGNRDPSGSMW